MFQTNRKEGKTHSEREKKESVAKERERTRPWELAEAPPSGWHVLGDLKDEKGEPSTELEKKGCGVVT